MPLKTMKADRRIILTAESRLPTPSVPEPIEMVAVWMWMLS
jgi:hypothetical protein